MGDKERPNTGREEPNEERNTEINATHSSRVRQNDAGPSGCIPLPGEVPEPHKLTFQSRTGLSKSEHNIRHIITSKDVANALKSLNINPINQSVSKDANIPVIDCEANDDKDETTFVDLKKFMASCFKMKPEPLSGIVLVDTPKQNLQPNAVITSDVVHDTPNTSCNLVQTDNAIANKTDEVDVANAKGVEERQSKVTPEKKKTSGNLSEKSDYTVTQRDSLSSIGSNVCRICMTRGRERLISPCNCKGSLANVHLSCLERWLNQVGRNHCELCGFSYPAIRTPRYTVVQALRLWFGNPRNRSHLQSDCLIFWLLSTVTAGLLAVCIVGTQYFVIEGNKFGKLDAGLRKEEGLSHRITETAMDFFMAIVLCGYSVTVYLLWKDHYVMWNRWRRANVNVRLLLSPDANPVPFVPRPQYNMV